MGILELQRRAACRSGEGHFGELETERLNKVTRYIAEHATPDEPVFVVPWAAGFYFLTDRSNPTRTDFMLFEDPESYPCILSRLDQQPPKYVDLWSGDLPDEIASVWR